MCERRIRFEAPPVVYMGGGGGVVGSDCAVWPGVAWCGHTHKKSNRQFGTSDPAGRRDVRCAAGVPRPAVASNRAWVVGPNALNALKESSGNRWKKKSEVQVVNRRKT